MAHDGFETPRTTGFPSLAQSWQERELRLDDLLILNPAATYFLRVADRSMQEAGIFVGDIVVVDRSVEATHGAIIVASVRGAFTIKRVLYVGDKILLQSEHFRVPTFEVTPAMRFQVFGVVLFVVHGVHPLISLDAALDRYRRRERP